MEVYTSSLRCQQMPIYSKAVVIVDGHLGFHRIYQPINTILKIYIQCTCMCSRVAAIVYLHSCSCSLWAIALSSLTRKSDRTAHTNNQNYTKRCCDFEIVHNINKKSTTRPNYNFNFCFKANCTNSTHLY